MVIKKKRERENIKDFEEIFLKRKKERKKTSGICALSLTGLKDL